MDDITIHIDCSGYSDEKIALRFAVKAKKTAPGSLVPSLLLNMMSQLLGWRGFLLAEECLRRLHSI